MKIYAVIVAGGSGSRMGSITPKQFLNVLGKPLLHHTLRAFIEAFADVHIILVLPADNLAAGEELARQSGATHPVRVTAGGTSRFLSVKAGLQFVEPDSITLVHDGVRCLVTPALIRHCCQVAIEKGNAIPAISSTDSMRMEINGYYEQVDRNTLKLIQTPQAFKSELLKAAYDNAAGGDFTDESGVTEAWGVRINLVEGESENIKITRPVDLPLAELILKTRLENKTTG